MRHEPFDSLDEAEEAIEHGGAIDVAIMEITRLPRLIEAGVLRRANLAIPNFKYVSQSFRDLNFDLATGIPCRTRGERQGSW